MASPRALIVDDSRTAQVRLKKLLRRYDVQVDTATSAEQALGYLTYQLPVVIFMDHMMAGMDGFEALRVIKTNPETATIPVVMYTSKTDEMYIGQARALGAVGVLAKDAMKASSVEPVLDELNIRRLSKEELDANKAAPLVNKVEKPEAAQSSGYDPKPLPPSVDAVESIRKQVAKSLEMNIASVRQEISDSGRVLSSRLVRELKEIRSQVNTFSGRYASVVDPIVAQPAEPVKSGIGVFAGILLFAVVIFSSFSAYTLYKAGEKEQSISRELSELKDLVATGVVSEPVETQVISDANTVDVEQLLRALSWSFNRSGQVSFERMALSSDRLSLFTGLSHHLNQSGYKGEIIIELRRGDFCVNFNDEGFMVLAAEGALQAECKLLSDYESEGSLDDWLSQDFIDFTTNSPVFASGDLRVLIQSRGFDDPFFQYPVPDVSTTADDWNSIAAMNNRVDIRFLRDN